MNEPDGFSGQWLCNDRAEAFVASEPWPRLLIFRMLHGHSPLRINPHQPWIGLRTWFLEPAQTHLSGLPAQQPTECLPITPLSLRLQGSEEPETKLTLAMDIAMDPLQPHLTITHHLTNTSDQPRRLALWAICATPRCGVGIAPSCEPPVLWPGFADDESCLHADQQSVAVDFRQLPDSGSFKVGIKNDSGWIAYLWKGGSLISTVGVDAQKEYPEGGGTVTIFTCGSATDEGWSEIENVGPLTNIDPGHTISMQQQLHLLPPVDISGHDPNKWLHEIPPFHSTSSL